MVRSRKREPGKNARRPNSKARGLTSDRAVHDPSDQQGRRLLSPRAHLLNTSVTSPCERARTMTAACGTATIDGGPDTPTAPVSSETSTGLQHHQASATS